MVVHPRRTVVEPSSTARTTRPWPPCFRLGPGSRLDCRLPSPQVDPQHQQAQRLRSVLAQLALLAMSRTLLPSRGFTTNDTINIYKHLYSL